MTAPFRPSPSVTPAAYPTEPPTTRMDVPLVTGTLAADPGQGPRFADLPTSPPAYHEDEASEHDRPHAGSRNHRPTKVKPLERLLLVSGAVLVVLVLAKVVADVTDLDTNVFDALLYAALALVVGVVTVGVGGGLIDPMRARWSRMLDR